MTSDFIAIDWIIVAFAAAGVILNIRKRWEGFAFWLVSNAWWAWVTLRQCQYAQAFLFVLFFFASIYGLVTWYKRSWSKPYHPQFTKSRDLQYHGDLRDSQTIAELKSRVSRMEFNIAMLKFGINQLRHQVGAAKPATTNNQPPKKGR